VVSTVQRILLRAAMARPWAALSWKAYLPKLYAGRRPADFDAYRDQVAASIRRPGYARAFALTTRTSHPAAHARLAEVTAPVLVVMGERDPDFPDSLGEADWIAQAAHPYGAVLGVPRRWLRLEPAVLLAAALIAYRATGEAWWLVPAALLIPNLFMTGYLRRGVADSGSMPWLVVMPSRSRWSPQRYCSLEMLLAMAAAAATTRGNWPAGASANAWCRAAICSAVDGAPGWFRSAISRATELNT